MTDEREFHQLNHDQMNTLRELLQIETDECHYCKTKIDFKKDQFSIYSRPTRIICNSIVCVSEAIGDDE